MLRLYGTILVSGGDVMLRQHSFLDFFSEGVGSIDHAHVVGLFLLRWFLSATARLSGAVSGL